MVIAIVEEQLSSMRHSMLSSPGRKIKNGIVISGARLNYPLMISDLEETVN